MHVKRSEFYAREKANPHFVELYTMDYFCEDCFELLAEIRPIEKITVFSGSVAIAAQTVEPRQSTTSSSFDKVKEARNTPPKGVKPEEWVTSWLNGPQKKDGGCSFCRGRHTVKACFFLIPEIRFQGWMPKSSLWCYRDPRMESIITDSQALATGAPLTANKTYAQATSGSPCAMDKNA